MMPGRNSSGAARAGSSNASRRFNAVASKPVLGEANKENFPGSDLKSGYNAATGQVEAPPKRLSGDKRTSSHPEVDGAGGDQKRGKKTYTPHQSKESGHYHVVLGEDLSGTPDPERWKILDLVGEGTFAKVVEAWDRKRKTYVAVKLVRAIEKYVRDAKFEINMLHRIREDDVQDFYPTIKYRSYFFADSPAGQHMCIVFPKLGFCLLDYLQRCRTFQLHEVAHIAWQMGAALNYLHAHLRLVHTDLKPENILLEHPCEQIDKQGNRSYKLPACTKVRIIDFGGATDEKHSRFSIVSTRHYRAPEVILGQQWMWGTDVWSTGCILYELFTGKLLYDTHENREHLLMMERTLGRVPSFYSEVSNQDGAKYFDRTGAVDQKWLHGTDHEAMKSSSKLRRMQMLSHTVSDSDFADLLRRCLEFDKTKRIRAHDIMYHPFVVRNWPEATKQNERREQYEVQQYGHILGKADTPTRVQEPQYERRGAGGYSSGLGRPY